MGALSLFAQVVGGGYSFVQVAIAIVVVIALVALIVVFAQSRGVTIPPLLAQVFYICTGAVIVILAILFIARIAGWA